MAFGACAMPTQPRWHCAAVLVVALGSAVALLGLSAMVAVAARTVGAGGSCVVPVCHAAAALHPIGCAPTSMLVKWSAACAMCPVIRPRLVVLPACFLLPRPACWV